MIASLLAAVARLVAGSSVAFAERLDGDGRRRVYLGNHTSHLDFVVIWSSLPPALRRRTRPVAAADYWLRGRFRRFLACRVFRAVLVDRAQEGRAARGGLERMLEALAAGDSLILFPEGTRGDGGAVGPFRSGLYHLCRHAGDLELVPVHLDNLNRILPKGEFVPVPMISRVTFGSPLRLERGEPKAAFLERARAAVEELGA